MRTKERIEPPSASVLREGSALLRAGDGVGGRVLAEERVAKRQHVKRPKGVRNKRGRR